MLSGMRTVSAEAIVACFQAENCAAETVTLSMRGALCDLLGKGRVQKQTIDRVTDFCHTLHLSDLPKTDNDGFACGDCGL